MRKKCLCLFVANVTRKEQEDANDDRRGKLKSHHQFVLTLSDCRHCSSNVQPEKSVQDLLTAGLKYHVPFSVQVRFATPVLKKEYWNDRPQQLKINKIFA